MEKKQIRDLANDKFVDNGSVDTEKNHNDTINVGFTNQILQNAKILDSSPEIHVNNTNQKRKKEMYSDVDKEVERITAKKGPVII